MRIWSRPMSYMASMRQATEQAMLEERAVSYGRLIGVSDDEITRTIDTHRNLARTTPYAMNWNRARDDLLAIVYPHSTLGRTHAAADDERRG